MYYINNKITYLHAFKHLFLGHVFLACSTPSIIIHGGAEQRGAELFLPPTLFKKLRKFFKKCFKKNLNVSNKHVYYILDIFTFFF